jgi:hypothetical protein
MLSLKDWRYADLSKKKYSQIAPNIQCSLYLSRPHFLVNLVVVVGLVNIRKYRFS